MPIESDRAGRLGVVVVLSIAVVVAGIGLWLSRPTSVVLSGLEGAPLIADSSPAFTAVLDGMAGQCQPETLTPTTGAPSQATLPPCPVQSGGTTMPLPECSDPTLNQDAPQTTLAPWLCDDGSAPRTTLAPPGAALPPEMMNCIDGATPTTEADGLNRPTTTVFECEQVNERRRNEYCQAVTGAAMVGSTNLADSRERYAALLGLVATLAPPEHEEVWRLLRTLEAEDFSYSNFNPAADELDGQWPDIEGMCPDIGRVVLGYDGILTVLQ